MAFDDANGDDDEVVARCRLNPGYNGLMRTTSVAACLAFLVSACGAEEGSGKGVYTLEFGGKRHTLQVTLSPRITARVPGGPAADAEPFDLVIANESGYPLRVRGDGKRSVAFVGTGGAAMFETACACDDFPSLQEALKNLGVYFSPQLKPEEAVPGAVFLAKIHRDREQVAMARILIVSVGDTSLELRVSVGPAWRND